MHANGDLVAGRDGFTLVEVCVASLLTALMVASVLGVFSMSRRGVVLVEKRLAALHTARATLEDLGRYSFDATELSVGETPLPDNLGRYVVSLSDDGRVKDVKVFVDYFEPSGDRHEVSLTTTFSRSIHK
ncbi:MAG: hypothetical protein PHR35_00755 [Kiritimatiellae bacterium]|nr:hypothetical protein [Kiritimatiellia bacterium]